MTSGLALISETSIWYGQGNINFLGYALGLFVGWWSVAKGWERYYKDFPL